MATQNFPEANLVKTTDLKLPISIDVSSRFTNDVNKLLQVLGVARKRSVTSGTAIRLLAGYKATLENGNVPEGDVIPLSKVTAVTSETKTLELAKYRKATSAEAIQSYGEDNAVNMTDEELLNEIQLKTRKEFIGNIKKGTGSETAVAHGLQGAVATAWAALEQKFDGKAKGVTVAFVNPLDVAKYLGNAQIQQQTAFGLTFLQAFTNTIIIPDSSVEAGTVWATVPENLELVYVNPLTSELARTFGLSGDASGFIGLTHNVDHKTMTLETIVVHALELIPLNLDGIVKVAITAGV